MAAAACEAVRVKRSFYDADPEAEEFSLSKRCRPLLPMSANKDNFHHRSRMRADHKSPFAKPSADTDNSSGMAADTDLAAISGMDIEKYFVGAKRRRKVGGDKVEEDRAGPAAPPEFDAMEPMEPMAADSPRKEEPILFTLAQVKSIVQSALEEREAELQAKYDAILAERLADQFTVFSKFNLDYIHSTFRKDSECSYMS